MWIQRKIFPLIFFARYNPEIELPDVNVYNSDLESLQMSRTQKNGIDWIEISVTMPGTLFIELKLKIEQYYEIDRMILSGIPINKEKIPQIVKFREHADIKSYQDFQPCTISRLENSGILSIDFFDHNPFKYLLKIGNKIPI